MNTYSDIKSFIQKSELIESDFVFTYGTKTGLLGQPHEVANMYVKRQGYKTIGNSWKSVSKAAGCQYVSRLLNLSLAYKVEMFTLEKANYLADRICSLFDPYNTTFLVNGVFYEDGFSCDPIGDATFELSIVMFDNSNIGMLYVEDED